MSGVFLSYRRDDTAGDARRIYERLAERFGPELVYLDVEDIPLGVDFVEHLTAALDSAAYVLIAIGPRWLLVTDDEGRRRLEDPEDPVRYEIRLALEKKRLVVPMLIGGAGMPKKRELPEEIAPLVRHNGIAIRPDPDFEADVDALMDGLHEDRIDAKRVPVTFSVGRMARDLALGGSAGWSVLGAGLGLLALSQGGNGNPVQLTLAGAGAGLVGGGFVGWLSGLLIRGKAPPLVSSSVRRMGMGWSFSLVAIIALSGVIGYFAGMDAWTGFVDSANGFGAAIGAIFAGMLVFLVTIMFISLIGLVVGSGITATYFARRLRMRSEEISRARGFALGIVWLLGAFVSAATFIGLLALFSA